MRKENITILILLLISFFVGSVSASCGAGETLVEHYWYEDHFDDDATISDWVGDNPDMSNWYISESNSSLEANDDSPSEYVMMDQSKFKTGNYSFRAKKWEPSTRGIESGIIMDDLSGWGQYAEFTNNDDGSIEFGTQSGTLFDTGINTVSNTGWNWYNITYYESGGDSLFDVYVNNTFIDTGVDGGNIYNPNYIFMSSIGNLIQFDYISYTNWSCEAESVPPPIITTSIIDPNLVDWRNLSAMISNVPKIIPGILAMVLGILPLVLIGLIIGLVIGLFGDIIDIMKNLSQYFK